MKIEVRSADKNKDYDFIVRESKFEGCNGSTYIFDESMTAEDYIEYWFPHYGKTFIIQVDQEPAGIYKIAPNHQGRGSHVANASYLVGRNFRNLGLGLMMGNDSQDQAKKMNFRALQFNLVIASNFIAVKLWEKIGFKILGTLPEAFRNKDGQYEDALIMHKKLI